MSAAFISLTNWFGGGDTGATCTFTLVTRKRLLPYTLSESPRHARGPRTHSRRAGVVFENAAAGGGNQTRGGATKGGGSGDWVGQPAGAGNQTGGGRTSGARSGYGDRHPASYRKTARRSAAGDEWATTETSAGPDGKCAPGTQPDGGTNRKGAGAETC